MPRLRSLLSWIQIYVAFKWLRKLHKNCSLHARIFVNWIFFHTTRNWTTCHCRRRGSDDESANHISLITNKCVIAIASYLLAYFFNIKWKIKIKLFSFEFNILIHLNTDIIAQERSHIVSDSLFHFCVLSTDNNIYWHSFDFFYTFSYRDDSHSYSAINNELEINTLWTFASYSFVCTYIFLWVMQ